MPLIVRAFLVLHGKAEYIPGVLADLYQERA
jgi:hypothetical protein